MLTDKENLDDLRTQVEELNQRLARMDIEFLSLEQMLQRLVFDCSKREAQD